MGSLGTLVIAPMTQATLSGMGWRVGVALFVVLTLSLMLPAAFMAGGADKLPARSGGGVSMKEVLGQAARHRGFLVMSGAYFVCGLQLVFLTTHLPTYLAMCGMDPMLSAEALASIGGVNCIGSWLPAGWAGVPEAHPAGAALHPARSRCYAYFVVPPTPSSTLMFAAAMGICGWA